MGSTMDRKLIAPTELCHVVLKTTPGHYQTMINWYCTFLGGRVAHASPNITFLTYDKKDHRIAIMPLPELAGPEASKRSVGLAHMSFGFDSLHDLVTSYEQKKANNVLPHWCVNHGMTTSMYYHDPDGNGVETQVDNFDSTEECVAYMESKAFEENPIGADFDPEDLVRRVRDGEDERMIKRRPDVGIRLTV